MRTLPTLLRCLGILLLWSFGLNAFSQTHTISGRLLTPNGVPMPGVIVHITGSVNSFAVSDTTGHYEASLPTGGAYTIAPYSNAEPLNGVSTFDAVLISRHVSGVQVFDSPYKIIAADADNDGQVTMPLDSIELRKLILFQVTEFSNNTSWRFVRTDYVFPDPANPFQPPYPENFTTPNLNTDLSNIDFIGIKIGDVNFSAAIVPGSLTDTAYLSWIDGLVAVDEQNNCQLDSSAQRLQNWIVKASGLYGNYYGKTNANGAYSIATPPGTYDVTVFPPNDLWDPCTPTQTGVSTALYNHSTVDFPIGVAIECPYLEVDLSAPLLRRCFPNHYYVSYCNQGTIAATDAYVEIAFDTFLTVFSSSIPWTTVSGNTYTFPLGDVPAGACGSFSVTVLLDCNAAPGQTHCSTAHIYPDSLCAPTSPLWNGANLEVSGACNGDQVEFTIRNTGTAVTQAADYVIIEDVMIQMTSSTVQLGPGEQDVITVPANGSTWRLEVDQAPNHPWSLTSSATVEGCGTNGNGSFSMGIVTQFPYDDKRPAFDMDCLTNISSYDPNDKAGFPEGVLDEHFIPRGQELTYKIRFQNTGTDTAFNIVLLDTLSDMLDLRTFRAGASSHPYTYNILGPGVIQFLFQNILLPDSNVNEPLSHGFVQFTIAPRNDLSNNSVIENSAAIYFDFNDPVITNKTWHTVGELYLSISNVVFQPGIELEVFPNPAVQHATFRIKSPRPMTGRFLLFDPAGRQIRSGNFDSNQFDVRADGLAPGLYFFRLESDGRAIAAGKLIVGD